jgi:hypothetical protein
MMSDLFTLRTTTAFDGWGDYGDILCNGLSFNDDDKPLRLGRCGSFVPPISFPVASQSIVVTDSARIQLAATAIKGIGEFHQVVVEKAVAVEWTEWDKTKKLDGDKLPFNGEPEEYILHNAADASIAAKLETLWEWRPCQVGTIVRSSAGVGLQGVLGKCDVFRLHDSSWKKTIANETGKEALAQIFSHWIAFEKLPISVLS